VSPPLLEASGLAKLYPVGSGRKRGTLHAVDGVDLVIGEGESMGLVGESGCGKSTLARLLARLVDPTAGRLLFAGEDIGAVPLRRFVRHSARRHIQVVFQDPTESLNPHFKVFDAIADPARRLGSASSTAEVEAKVRRVAGLVGLPPELLGRTRTSSRAASAPGSASRAPSWSSPGSWSSTSQPRPSTSRSRP